jgi:predicted nucleotidyltransferase
MDRMKVGSKMTRCREEDVLTTRELLRRRRAAYRQEVWQEVERLTAAAKMGVQRVILFGSLLQNEANLSSDLDLLIVWDTRLGFLERTAELYRRLQPRVSADLLAYTPDELDQMAHTSFVRRALAEGRVLYEA